MKKQITVDNAVMIGYLMVNVPVFIVLIGCPALALYLSRLNLISGWGIGMGFLIGFVLAWLVWSITITKWRIWAFEHVRNVHELKKRAIQEKLIWKDGSFFENTEIRSSKDKARLKKLEKKFEKEDEYKEDYSLPSKTEIFYSKALNYFELGTSILIIGVGIYFLLKGETNYSILGSVMFVIGLYSAVKESRKTLNKPQITVDNTGITTKNVGFKDWSSIKNEEVIQESYGKSAKSYLTYFYDKNKYEKVEIDPLNVTHRELENIIRTYRMRSDKNDR